MNVANCHHGAMPGNSRNAYTTTYTHFRVPVVRQLPDGSSVTTYKTLTRKRVTIDPAVVYDPHADYGPFWEDD